MPPIHPDQLLKALGPLLSNTGGIKGAKEALKIVSLMKDASKLVTRCVYLNILRATDSEDAFSKFVSEGGWDVLNAWLDVARSEGNWPLLGELLEVYLRIPVSVSVLKQNSAAKTIKKMQAKTEDDKIKTLATQLVDIWMKIIRGQNNGNHNTEADSDEKKKKAKHKEKDAEKDEKDKNHKDSRRSKDEKENSDRHRNRDRDSKDSNDADRKERDRHKDKDKSRRDKDKDRSKSELKDSSSSKLSKSSSSSSSSSAHKNKDTSSSSSSSLRKPSTEDSKSLVSSSTTDKSKSTNSSESAKDEESKKRPKTVKQIGSRIRSTGLFEEDDDEEKQKEAARRPLDKLASKRSTNDPKEETLEKKPRLHLNMPPLSSANLTSSTTTPPEVMHGRIKIIPAKKAPAHEIQDSNVFMDALNQSTSYASLGLKKKKKPTSSVTTPPVLQRSTSLSSSSLLPPTLTATTTTPGGLAVATSPPLHNGTDGVEDTTASALSPPLLSPTTAMAQKLPSVPSFYRDTLEETPEKEEKKDEPKEEDKDSPPVLELMIPIEEKKEEKPAEKESDMNNADPPLDFDNAERDFEESEMDTEPPKPSKPKKTVSWAKESQMEQIFYFEMDETERENVNRPKSFSDLKKEEMVLDKRAMESAKRFNNDMMVEVLPWKLPKLIDGVIQVVEPGCNSAERQIQMDREQSVLCALFFNKVPDTPNEPEVEMSQEVDDMKIIPVEDESGSCTEYEHTYNFNDPTSLPYDPEFGSLPLGGPGQHQIHAPQGVPAPVMGQLNSIGGGIGNIVPGMGMMGAGGPLANLPPAISHILTVLEQQANETRDPVMQNLQGMLTNVMQTTNPQDSNLLVERILGALDPFRSQIPGLGSLINSVQGSGANGGVGGRFMGGPPTHGMGGNPRHGLLGSAPPGFNMDAGAAGPGANMRKPGPMMNNGGGNFFMDGRGGRDGGRGGGDRGRGGGGGDRGGPPSEYWREQRSERRGGGGRSRPFKRGGGNRHNTVCMFYASTRSCKFGDKCQFLHHNS